MKQDRLIFVHLVASLFMTGVIWMVQLVHYPLFDRVPAAGFVAFEQSHAFRIAFVVMPPMLMELVTAGLLLGSRGTGRFWLAGLTGAIWLLTFLIHMPQHEALAQGFDTRIHQELVLTNWARTLLWTIKSALASCLFLHHNHARQTSS